MGLARKFFADEAGAVSVDWVVLTSGIVILAIAVMPPIQTAIVDMAIYIGDTITRYQSVLE